MGEAKRRRAKGLAPKAKKIETKDAPLNIFIKYPRAPLYIGIIFAIYLIIDWIKLNSSN
tara:strand:+ start:896 stop:1072 length:177 start_codon:yes stop_codon:yes gene_type:complete